MNFLYEISNFANGRGGSTMDLMHYLHSGNFADKPSFKPYKSSLEFFYRATDIVVAPLLSSYIALVFAYESVKSFIYSIVSIAQCDLTDASNNILESGRWFLASLEFLSGALLGPIINTIELIGSGALTLINYSTDLAK